MLIDGHTHAFLPEDLEVLGERLAMLDRDLEPRDPNKWQIHAGGTVEDLARSMERCGAERWVLLPVTGSKGRIGELNRWAAGEAARDPRIIPFGTLHPAAEPERQLAELKGLGLKGVKLHPFVQRIDLDSPEVGALFRLLAGERVPVLVDTIQMQGLFAAKPHLKDMLSFFGFMGCRPPQVAALARANPGLPIIAAHMGSLYGWQSLDELLALDNVYFDLAYVNGLLEPREAVEIIRAKGPERVIYGSDAPWREPAAFREWFEDLPLSSGEREMIAAGTLLTLLGEA